MGESGLHGLMIADHCPANIHNWTSGNAVGFNSRRRYILLVDLGDTDMQVLITMKRIPRRLGGVLSCLVALLATSLAAHATPVNDDAIAVIIGNETYDGSIPEVSFAHNDADAFRQFVVDGLGYREGNIIDLRDATFNQLVTVFGNDKTHEGKLFDFVRSGESDVTVFYSGHGVPGLKDKRAYLLPSNGDPNRAEISGYPIATLYRNLSKLSARSIRVFIDACFSGQSPKGMLVKAASGISITPKAPKGSSRMVILTAAQGDQLASWDEEAKHGLFTKHLLEALYGAADKKKYGDGNGQVSLAEVGRYLGGEMTYQARRRFGRVQEASLTGMGSTVLAHKVMKGIKFVSVGVTSKQKTKQQSQANNSKKMEQIVALAQAKAAKALREQLPIQVDSVTTLQSALSVGKTLIYNYLVAVKLDEIDRDAMMKKIGKTLKNNVCGQEKMVSAMNYGGSFRYVYMAEDGNLIGDIMLTAADCRM